MSVSLTEQFMTQRKKFHPLMPQYVEPKQPQWFGLVEKIEATSMEILSMQTQIEELSLQLPNMAFSLVTEDYITNLRAAMKAKMFQQSKQLKLFKEIVDKAATEKNKLKLDKQLKSYGVNVYESFVARGEWLGQNLKDQQARFLDDIESQVQRRQHMADKSHSTVADQLYKQAQEEIKMITGELMELVELINGLTQSIYEQGTILNRIDQFLTEAEASVQSAVVDLEKTIEMQQGYNPLDPASASRQEEAKADNGNGGVNPETNEAESSSKERKPIKKDKLSINKLRGVTYSILGTDYIILIITIILKASGILVKK